MAIDTSMFAAAIPAAAYTKGQVVTLGNVRGPAIVRDGYGAAYLKRVMAGCTNPNSAGIIRGHITIKNSNWVDSLSNLLMAPNNVALAENSSNIQKGHDAPLTPNSGWEVTFTFDEAVTTTAATDVFALIDVDYPSVQAVQNPREAKGLPVTTMRDDTIAVAAYGGLSSAAWTTFNIDILKAGSKYLLVELGSYINGAAIAFISISGAAGQNGLERIIPAVVNNLGNLRFLLDYSTPLVKGPMNLNYLAIGGSAGSAPAITEIDWVKNKA